MTTSNEKSYFDLHITGLGYLNRIREVKPKKGDSFLACDIAALNGPSDDVSYVRFDARVSGSEAQHLVLHPGALELDDGGLVERGRQIEALDVGAERGPGRDEVETGRFELG